MRKGISMTEKLLEVKHLKKSFGFVTAVDDVSFEMSVGDSVGIVGESGCGKSTLVRLISGLQRPDAGEILVSGQFGNGDRRGEKKCHINMVFQDPIDSFDPRFTVFQSLYEALCQTVKCKKTEGRARVMEALRLVSLPLEYMDRKLSSLSGGECQRVAIARVILTEPRLFICDEATSALDVSVQAQMIQLFADLKKKRKFSYLFISHDLAVVACLCTKILVMYKGKIVERGEVSEIMEHPRHPYTKLLVDCAKAFSSERMDLDSTLPDIPGDMETW